MNYVTIFCGPFNTKPVRLILKALALLLTLQLETVFNFIVFKWSRDNCSFCIVFTVRCYAEPGCATVCRLPVCLSVCPSVTFMTLNETEWLFHVKFLLAW